MVCDHHVRKGFSKAALTGGKGWLVLVSDGITITKRCKQR
jgi:hypothetical protein